MLIATLAGKKAAGCSSPVGYSSTRVPLVHALGSIAQCGLPMGGAGGGPATVMPPLISLAVRLQQGMQGLACAQLALMSRRRAEWLPCCKPRPLS